MMEFRLQDFINLQLLYYIYFSNTKIHNTEFLYLALGFKIFIHYTTDKKKSGIRKKRTATAHRNETTPSRT